MRGGGQVELWGEVAVLFNVHPWQMVRLPVLRRVWYEQAALRHREREAETHRKLFEGDQ